MDLFSGVPAGAGGQARAKSRPGLARHPCLTSSLASLGGVVPGLVVQDRLGVQELVFTLL